MEEEEQVKYDKDEEARDAFKRSPRAIGRFLKFVIRAEVIVPVEEMVDDLDFGGVTETMDRLREYGAARVVWVEPAKKEDDFTV